MIFPLIPSLLCFALLATPPAMLAAEEGGESGDKKEQAEVDQPSTHTVKPGMLDLKVELTAFFESQSQAALSIDPESWTDLSVLEAVPHGARVRKGDTVLSFDLEKIDEQIEALEESGPTKKLALEIAQAELTNLEQSTPLKLAAAERNRRRADEDYTYFESVDRAEREKAAEFSVKNAEQRLANAQEELDQLLKMYEADDLTEETEEIILKRQQFAVESSEYFLENAKRNAERSLEVHIPREGENLKSQKQEQELAWELSRVTLPRNLEQKRLQVDKLEKELAEAEEKLHDMKSDREMLVVRAPQSGIVYYGDSEHGKWTTGAAVAKKLLPGGKVSPREVFMTIVDPDEIVIKAVVPENKLARLETGLKGEASPVSDPDLKIPATLEELSYIALPSGGFPATISMKKPRRSRLMPGMSCQVVFGDTEREEVLLAPKSAVFEDGDEQFVYLAAGDGEPEKREVETGEQDDKMIEIKSGLAGGDKILLKKPN